MDWGRLFMLTAVGGISGIASQVVGFAFLTLSIYNSPWFIWTEHDLSFFGAEGSATRLFNSGVVIAGILSLIFATGLWWSPLSNRWLGRIAIACLILGSAALSATGTFPRNIVIPHNIASLAFFTCIAIAIFLFGLDAITGGSVIWGWLSIIAAVLMVAFQQFPWPWTGGAIPQLLSCLPWSLWTVALAVRLLASPESLSFKP